MSLLFESRIGNRALGAGLAAVAALTFSSLTRGYGVEPVDVAPPAREANAASNAGLIKLAVYAEEPDGNAGENQPALSGGASSVSEVPDECDADITCDTWEAVKLTVSGAVAEELFGGLAVSVSGDTAVVGAIVDDCAAGSNCGAAYVFRFNGTSWVEEQKLTASDAAAGDIFGKAVSVSGGTAVVGAVVADCAAGSNCGAAYVFRFNGTSWVEEQKLTASDAAAGDTFGSAVCVSGDLAVVGAPGYDYREGESSEAAYVFRFNGTSWVEEQKLAASDTPAGDRFGNAVSVSGVTAVVGAFTDDCAPGDACGSAYVFRFNGTSWVEEQKLTASDAAEFDLFGNSVSVSGDSAVVGAYRDNCTAGVNCGSAYVFRFNGTNWVEEQKLTASDAAADNRFGGHVSVSGDTAMVGAHEDDCAAGSRCASVYMFDLTGPDYNCNGVADVCECTAPASAEPEPTVHDMGHGSRVRYLSFSGGAVGESEAIRVQFDIGNGPKRMWVQEPFQIVEASGEPGPGEPGIWAATMDCIPYFTDWTQWDSIHVLDESIIPSQFYDIALVKQGCETRVTGYSAPLVVVTSGWGDLVATCDDAPCGPPDGDADFDDISSVVDKFKNLPGAPMKSRADVMPEVPDFKVDFGDIPAVVDGFRGLPYPYNPPADPCP